MPVISECIRMASERASSSRSACRSIIPAAIVACMTMLIPILSYGWPEQMLALAVLMAGLFSMVILFNVYRSMERSYVRECTELMTCSALLDQLGNGPVDEFAGRFPSAAAVVSDGLFRFAQLSDAEAEALIEVAFRRITAKGPSSFGDILIDDLASAAQSS